VYLNRFRRVKQPHEAAGGCCREGDGQTLASVSYNKLVKVWDIATGQQRFSLEGHTGGIIAVAFAPSGNEFASANLVPDISASAPGRAENSLIFNKVQGFMLELITYPLP
jgi:WD40 repeat protein